MAHFLIAGSTDPAKTETFQNSVSNSRGCTCLRIAAFIIQKGGKESGDTLQLPKRKQLVQPGGMNHMHGGIVPTGNVVELNGSSCEPGVAPGPECIRKVMTAVKGPAVIEKTGDLVLKVTDMNQELVFRFINECRTIKDNAGFGKKQSGHKQRVCPQLPIMLVKGSAVLETVKFGARHVVHNPGNPGLDFRKIGFLVCFCIKAGEGQDRGYGIDVAVWLFRPAQHIIIPGAQIVKNGGITAALIGLVDSVESNAGRPFPVVHGQMTIGGIVSVGMLQHIENAIRDCTIVHPLSPLQVCV